MQPAKKLYPHESGKSLARRIIKVHWHNVEGISFGVVTNK